MSLNRTASADHVLTEWPELPLSELIEPLASGSRPKGGVRGIEDGVPSVGGEHITAHGGFDFTRVKYVPHKFYESMRRGHILPGDILIVKDGATTAKVALVRDDFPFSEAVVNEHVFILRPKANHDSRYIFWYLHSNEGQERILEHFQGAAQGGINQRFAPGTHVPVPPTLEIEASLADQIETLVNQMKSPADRLATVPTLLKKFRQCVLTAACSGQITIDWREANKPSESAEQLLHRIHVERKLKSVPKPVTDENTPEYWSRARIGEICAVATGATPLRTRPAYYGGSIPWITSSAVNDGIVTQASEFITDMAVKETNAKVFAPGTLIVAMYGEGQTRGRVAELGIATATNQALAALLFQGANQECKAFLKLHFLKNYEEMRTMAAGGVQPNLSLGLIRDSEILLPPLDEQLEIVRRVESLFVLADSIESRLVQATSSVERTTQAILAKAFRGELMEAADELTS